MKFKFIFILSLFLFSCAQEYPLEGGPKDVDKPQVKSSIPKKHSKTWAISNPLHPSKLSLNSGGINKQQNHF